MQLDNITIRDLSQIQKDKHYALFFFGDYKFSAEI